MKQYKHTIHHEQQSFVFSSISKNKKIKNIIADQNQPLFPAYIKPAQVDVFWHIELPNAAKIRQVELKIIFNFRGKFF